MKPRNNILVPIDFTESSKAGLATAKDLMTKTDSKLLVFNVVERHNVKSFRVDGNIAAHISRQKETDRFVIDLVAKRKKELAELLSQVGLNEDEVECLVYVGQFRDAMERIVDDRDDIIMIVMGSSGETNINEVLTGNHATQVTRALNLPVLVVQEYRPSASLAHILLWINKDNLVNERLTTISRLTGALNAKVSILGITTHKEENSLKRELTEFAERNEFDNFEIMTTEIGHEMDNISNILKVGKYDAIATLSSRTSVFMRLFVGDDIEHMVNQMDVPVLAVTS